MKTFWTVMFHWPDGGVWSNLLASLLWAVPGLIHLHRKQNRHQKEVMSALGIVKEEKKMVNAIVGWVKSHPAVVSWLLSMAVVAAAKLGFHVSVDQLTAIAVALLSLVHAVVPAAAKRSGN